MEFSSRKPPLTRAIIDFLDTQYPDTLPRQRDMTLEELLFLQGQRSVVDFLIRIFEQED
jgi:hypothetical protein